MQPYQAYGEEDEEVFDDGDMNFGVQGGYEGVYNEAESGQYSISTHPPLPFLPVLCLVLRAPKTRLFSRRDPSRDAHNLSSNGTTKHQGKSQ